MPTFKERFGIAKGAMITGVDLLRGLATLLGWENLSVEGMTSFHDTNYAGQGQATARYPSAAGHAEEEDDTDEHFEHACHVTFLRLI